MERISRQHRPDTSQSSDISTALDASASSASGNLSPVRTHNTLHTHETRQTRQTRTPPPFYDPRDIASHGSLSSMTSEMDLSSTFETSTTSVSYDGNPVPRSRGIWRWLTSPYRALARCFGDNASDRPEVPKTRQRSDVTERALRPEVRLIDLLIESKGTGATLEELRGASSLDEEIVREVLRGMVEQHILEERDARFFIRSMPRPG